MNRVILVVSAILALVLATAAGAQAQDQGGAEAGGTAAPGAGAPGAGPFLPAPDQGQPGGAPGGAEAGGQGPQSAPQEWYVGKPIKDFTFTGLITIKAEDLRAIVAPYIGQSFSVDRKSVV